MQLILVRHAIALDREDFARKTGLDDSFRPLSLKGRKKMFKIASQLKRWVTRVDLMVSSPYVRAQQTSEILLKFYAKTKLVKSAELVPHSDPVLFLRWLRAHGKNNQIIMLVGHEPQLSTFASYLMSGKKQTTLALKKSGMACLRVPSWVEIEEGTAELEWLVQPRQLLEQK